MIRVEDIISLTAHAFGLDYHDLVSSRRHQALMRPRYVAMHVAMQATRFSTLDIGTAFHRDHTTVLRGLKIIGDEIAKDAGLRAVCQSLIDAAHYKALVSAQGEVDVLAISKRIVVDPKRNATKISAYEIAALSASLLDIWEVASAAETLLLELGEIDPLASNTADAERLNALREAILNEMEMVAGPRPAAQTTAIGE